MWKYSICLPTPKYNDLRDSTPRLDSHVTALLTNFIILESIYFLPYRFTNIILCH